MLSLLLAFVANTSAAEPCKGYKVKVDEFGGGTTVDAVAQAMSQYTAVSIVFQAKSGTAELLFTVKEGGALSASVPAGVELPFKLEDGTVLTLRTVRETITRPYVSSSSVMTMVPYSLALTADDLAHFVASPLSAVRLPLSTGPYDWKANKGVQKATMKAATCVASQMAVATAAPAP